MQPLASFSGKKTSSPANSDLNQPVSGWCDAKDHKDATLHVLILRHEVSAARSVKLIVQTATGAAGPWRDLFFYVGSSPVPPFNTSFAASTGGTASFQLERFVRWSIDTSALANTDIWTLCFGICVTLK